MRYSSSPTAVPLTMILYPTLEDNGRVYECVGSNIIGHNTTRTTIIVQGESGLEIGGGGSSGGSSVYRRWNRVGAVYRGWR